LSFGQEIYRSFLEEGKVWTYHYYNDMTGREFYKSLTIAGDTVIDDKSYKRIVDVATGNYEYAIREEGKKVFCANPNNAETLIYDFGLNVGDSFQSSGNSNSDTQTTVIGVDTVVVGNRAFRILDVRLNNDLWPNLWVEGVGGMYDLSSNFPKVGNFYSFSSCQLDGETILTQKDVWKTVGIHDQPIIHKGSYSTIDPLFDLQGRRRQGEPQRKGVYIHGGRKYVKR
jgi:hypothetical protein